MRVPTPPVQAASVETFPPRVFRVYEEGARLLREAARVPEMTIEEMRDYIERSRRFQKRVKEAQEDE